MKPTYSGALEKFLRENPDGPAREHEVPVATADVEQLEKLAGAGRTFSVLRHAVILAGAETMTADTRTARMGYWGKKFSGGFSQLPEDRYDLPPDEPLSPSDAKLAAVYKPRFDPHVIGLLNVTEEKTDRQPIEVVHRGIQILGGLATLDNRFAPGVMESRVGDGDMPYYELYQVDPINGARAFDYIQRFPR